MSAGDGSQPIEGSDVSGGDASALADSTTAPETHAMTSSNETRRKAITNLVILFYFNLFPEEQLNLLPIVWPRAKTFFPF